MNSDATNARTHRAARGERRFLRLGREGSAQLPSEEGSWLDSLEGGENEGKEMDGGEAGRLVGALLEWEDKRGFACDEDEGEGHAFWVGDTPPPPPPPLDTYSAAPLQAKAKVPPLLPGLKAKKRAFKVKRDGDADQCPKTPPLGLELQQEESTVLGGGRKAEGGRGEGKTARTRRRSVLRDGSPNVGAAGAWGQVGTPGMGTPGSYYDEEGFLRV
ncbi:hypothetical protein B5807_08803 [Epicoccum nigrum]|uniref:Uncharacterized protein n=1 Tax=Epicoccum nigrum TaxID=105696 RepID=A0A1Y2LS65_EPING|nr:hypothetical protein B5807_08803 [Epicoccum nigrum]